MKSPTSWTSQEVMRKCPRRFYFRYKDPDPTGQIKALKKLMSVRELGGQVIHEVLADGVRYVAAGGRISDLTEAPAQALSQFGLIVEQSRRLAAGVLHGDKQLAEIFNGLECSSEIADWEIKIPLAVGNGIRLMHYFNLRSNREGYKLEAETRGSFMHRGKERRFVIDVLIQDGNNTSVIDFKTHSITDSDRQQIALYQHYLLGSRHIPPTRLYGFAVDLLHEQVEEHHYRKIEHTFASTYTGYRPGVSSGPNKNVAPVDSVESYPARPSLEACGICAFSTICPESALKLPTNEVDLER